MKRVSELYGLILEEWSYHKPENIDDIFATPRISSWEYEKAKDVVQPILDDFLIVRDLRVSEELDGLRLLAYTKDSAASWVLGLYLLGMCEVMQGDSDVDVFDITFASFVTGAHFGEVLRGLSKPQMKLLADVLQHYLISIKKSMGVGLVCGAEFVPGLEEIVECCVLNKTLQE